MPPSKPYPCLTAAATDTPPTESGAGTAPDAPGGNPVKKPGEQPVASDSGASRVGIEPGTNQPGEKGLKDVPVPGETSVGSGGGGANEK